MFLTIPVPPGYRIIITIRRDGTVEITVEPWARVWCLDRRAVEWSDTPGVCRKKGCLKLTHYRIYHALRSKSREIGDFQTLAPPCNRPYNWSRG